MKSFPVPSIFQNLSCTSGVSFGNRIGTHSVNSRLQVLHRVIKTDYLYFCTGERTRHLKKLLATELASRRTAGKSPSATS